MKNVTIALDEETHRKARVYAAEQGTSLSALVKAYLNGLVDIPPDENGVREVAMPYAAAPVTKSADDGPPWLVDGKRVYTKDGKPRKPGAMRGMWVADDFDEWPEGFLDAIYGEDTEAADNWYKTAKK